MDEIVAIMIMWHPLLSEVVDFELQVVEERLRRRCEVESQYLCVLISLGHVERP